MRWYVSVHSSGAHIGHTLKRCKDSRIPGYGYGIGRPRTYDMVGSKVRECIAGPTCEETRLILEVSLHLGYSKGGMLIIVGNLERM